MNKIFIRVNWVVLVASTVGMVVCLALYFMDAISDRAMLGITLALSWLALVVGALSVLVTAYVKKDVEDG